MFFDLQCNFFKRKCSVRIFSRKLNFYYLTEFLYESVQILETHLHAKYPQSSDDEWVEAVPSQTPGKEKAWKVKDETSEKEDNQVTQVSHLILSK